ncbi:TPA: packaged DNA stabilization protein [Yersinia enterocolitica]
MSITSLTLSKGIGKDHHSADYVDLLPVNMLATPKEVLNSAGYLRSFPGIELAFPVNGVSRGGEFNTKENLIYRVCGTKLYKGQIETGNVAGIDRVSMAHSYNSQAVCSTGIVTLFRYDNTTKVFDNWPISSGYTQYELGLASDICRNRGRYIISKANSDSFFITDLEDESHPDKFSAEYRAESQPDGIIGVDAWRDYVLCFGSTTIEYFTLTGSSDASAAKYVSQSAYLVQKGIAGVNCKCRYADSHAIISNPATGAPSVYIIDSGRTIQIATASIEKILRGYTALEMSKAFMEAVRFDSHELLIIHLPKNVLVYDSSSSQNGPQWSVLKTGLNNDLYRGSDFFWSGNDLTCGDKNDLFAGRLNFSISSQYGEQQEHILFTPLFKADNARVFDFELESSTGVAQYADRLFLSATTDGIIYGQEKLIEQNAPFIYDKRVLLRKVGRVRKNIGIKIRVITNTPVTLSGCSVRIE